MGAIYAAFWANGERQKAEQATREAEIARAEIAAQQKVSDSLLVVINNLLQKTKAETDDNTLESRLDTVAQEVKKALENSRTGPKARMEKMVVEMFSEDKKVREKAYLALKRDYNYDENLIPFLIRYNRENFNFNQGIWNSLYVLEEMDEKTLLKEKELVSKFLEDVSLKGYGPSTVARIDRIKAKLK